MFPKKHSGGYRKAVCVIELSQGEDPVPGPSILPCNESSLAASRCPTRNGRVNYMSKLSLDLRSGVRTCIPPGNTSNLAKDVGENAWLFSRGFRELNRLFRTIYFSGGLGEMVLSPSTSAVMAAARPVIPNCNIPVAL